MGFVQSVQSSSRGLGETEHFDYLVNNAGTSHQAPFEKVTEGDFDNLCNIHFKGVFLPHTKSYCL